MEESHCWADTGRGALLTAGDVHPHPGPRPPSVLQGPSHDWGSHVLDRLPVPQGARALLTIGAFEPSPTAGYVTTDGVPFEWVDPGPCSAPSGRSLFRRNPASL